MSRYKPYSNYKDSEVEWLGKVPEYWQVKRLGQYFDDRREKVSDKEFQPLSVTKKGIVPQLETAAKTDDGDNRKKVCTGDYVINSRSDRKGSSGLSNLTGSVSLINTVLTPKNIEPLFIHHLFRSYPFQEEFYRYGKGIVADLWSTNYSEMKNINIPIPEYSEQTAIANFLDRETAKIDTLIAKQERMIELLGEKRSALISHAVTKGLDSNVKMKDSGVEWLGEVPEHWEIKKMKHVIKKIESGTSVNASNEPASVTEFGVLKTSCVYTGQFDPNENKTVIPEEIMRLSCPLQENTLIVSRMNTPDLVGAAGLVTFAPKNIYLPDRLWQVSFDFAVPAFIHYLTLTGVYRSYIQTVCAGTSSSMQNLSQDNFRDFTFALPDNQEQRVIADYLCTQTAKIDTLIAKARQAIELMKERRIALISAAVTGKIDVRKYSVE